MQDAQLGFGLMLLLGYTNEVLHCRGHLGCLLWCGDRQAGVVDEAFHQGVEDSPMEINQLFEFVQRERLRFDTGFKGLSACFQFTGMKQRRRRLADSSECFPELALDLELTQLLGLSCISSRRQGTGTLLDVLL